MGTLLFKIFKIVEQEGGVPARLEFAKKTKTTLNKVKTIKDKPEYVQKFSKIASSILGKNVGDMLPQIKTINSKIMSKTNVQGKDDDILL